MGFHRQEHWNGFPFPPAMDRVLSKLFTMNHPSWVALHGMAHGFIEDTNGAQLRAVGLRLFCCGLSEAPLKTLRAVQTVFQADR